MRTICEANALLLGVRLTDGLGVWLSITAAFAFTKGKTNNCSHNRATKTSHPEKRPYKTAYENREYATLKNHCNTENYRDCTKNKLHSSTFRKRPSDYTCDKK